MANNSKSKLSGVEKPYTGKIVTIGNYEYSFNQAYTSSGWEDRGEDVNGWGARFINRSTSKVDSSGLVSPFVGKLDGYPVIFASYMFASYMLTPVLDVSMLNTSEIVDMNGMFFFCSAKLVGLNHLDTSSARNMGGMFAYCKGTDDYDLSGFNTSMVEDMREMFYCCRAKSLNLSSFDTSNVVTMRGMFDRFVGPERIDLNNFVTSNVTDMSYMFQKYEGESVDISHFRYDSLEYALYMFFESKVETINAASFTGENVDEKYLAGMFGGCFSTTIDIRMFPIEKFDVETIFANMRYNYKSNPKIKVGSNESADALEKWLSVKDSPGSLTIEVVSAPSYGERLVDESFEYRFGLTWDGLQWSIPPCSGLAWGARMLPSAPSGSIAKKTLMDFSVVV